MKMKKRTVPLAYLALAAGASLLVSGANGQTRTTRHEADVVTGELAPDDPAELEREAAAAPAISSSELEALRQSYLERREKMEARALEGRGPDIGVDAALPERVLAVPPPTELGLLDELQSSFDAPTTEVAVPGQFVIGRNFRNSRANTTSTLAEPVASNEGPFVLYMGNTHQELSTNGGSTYVGIPIPAGPAEAPFACCDPDIIYDQGRGVTFRIWLYTNAAQTNGVVRIFVRRRLDLADACSYTIDPGGAANNVVPDYPHLGITNNHLYLTTNNVRSDQVWLGAQVRRFNIDQMSDCLATATTTFTYVGAVGQRVVVPAQGTRENMYWGLLDSPTVFRIFRWNQAAAAPTSVTRLVSASNFSNPDCRGGVGNFDFIERPTAFTITGFRLRGAVGRGFLRFYWHSAPIGAATQAHVRAAVFRETDLVLVDQPHIFNNTFCFGFPAVTTNERGDVGLTIASGGRAGGGGTAARGFVGIDDDFTPGNTFGTVFLTASGDRNRSDGRFGDYFNTLPHEPCDNWFHATNYALLSTLVNARYVEFGRARDGKCYTGWRSAIRLP
jgi:hypothetical protein